MAVDTHGQGDRGPQGVLRAPTLDRTADRLDIGSGEFRKLAHLLRLTAIECYGRPSKKALEQMQHKAVTLGDRGTVVSIGRFAGFSHLGSG